MSEISPGTGAWLQDPGHRDIGWTRPGCGACQQGGTWGGRVLPTTRTDWRLAITAASRCASDKTGKGRLPSPPMEDLRTLPVSTPAALGLR
jgi:hypothetical protein